MSKSKAVFIAARPLVNGWGHLEEHSNGGLYVGILNGDAGIGNENSANALDWRAYDRSIMASPQTPANTRLEVHWFQRNQIQSLTFGGVFASVHTCVGMENRLDFGVHTGLYSVSDEFGHMYICGLYPGANAGEMGWVKQDTVTGVWTSGIVTGVTKATGNRMSPCVSHEGRLVHTTNGIVTYFNPVDDSLAQAAYGNGSLADRPVASSGKLFIVSAGGGQIRVHEDRFGLNEQLDLGPHSISIANGGSFGILRFGSTDDHNLFYVVFYTASGGTGSRCYRIDTTSTGAPTSTERTTMVPTAAPLAHLAGTWPYSPPASTENLQWPGGTAHPNYSWESCADNVDTPPYATPSANTPWGHAKLLRYPYTSLVPGLTYGGVEFFFNGELAALSWAGISGTPPGGFTGIELLGELSISSQWNGGDDTRLNSGRPKWWPISAELYQDGTTPRGVLVKFWGQSGGAPGNQNVLVLYGREGQRPNLVASLVAGAPAVPPGGTGTFNGTDDRIDNCDLTDALFATLEHGTVSGGPFNVGATLQGATSGATAVVSFAAAAGAYVAGITGGPFTPLETITQTNGVNVGASATLASQEDAVTHQAVWDLDADGIPDGEWVTVQPLGFSGSGANPTGENLTHSGYTLTILTGSDPLAPTEPVDFEGPVVDALTETISGLTGSEGQVVDTLTEGPSADSEGQVVDTLTEGPSADSEGQVVDTYTDTDLVPQLVGFIGDEPAAGSGGVAFQEAGVENSSRPVVSFVTPALPGQAILVPPGGTVPDVRFELDGLVELGRVTVDAVNDAPGTAYPILDMDAEGLVLAGAVELRANLLAVSAFVGAPSFSLGVGGSFDDQLGTTALAISAAAEHEGVPLLQPRPILRPTEVLTLQLDVAASAGSYSVEIVVYGFHRIP